MAWLGISAVVLVNAGVLLPPVLGVILGRNLGDVSYALCAAGIALYGVYLLVRRPRGDRDTSSNADGGVSDAGTDFESHHSHDGGHGGDAGDGGH